MTVGGLQWRGGRGCGPASSIGWMSAQPVSRSCAVHRAVLSHDMGCCSLCQELLNLRTLIIARRFACCCQGRDRPVAAQHSVQGACTTAAHTRSGANCNWNNYWKYIKTSDAMM